MKLFLLFISFLFNVSTWALVDLEDNGHNIQNPRTNLRSFVADDLPQVILTSNEETPTTESEPALKSSCKKMCYLTAHTECGLLKQCPYGYHYVKTIKAHCSFWDNLYVCKRAYLCPC